MDDNIVEILNDFSKNVLIKLVLVSSVGIVLESFCAGQCFGFFRLGTLARDLLF